MAYLVDLISIHAACVVTLFVAMQLTGRIEGAVWKMTDGPFT